MLAGHRRGNSYKTLTDALGKNIFIHIQARVDIKQFRLCIRTQKSNVGHKMSKMPKIVSVYANTFSQLPPTLPSDAASAAAAV